MEDGGWRGISARIDPRSSILDPPCYILNSPPSYLQSVNCDILRPMRTIALMNQKGGVGKTTTAVNLGAALAELGHRVCMIDLDPQAHLTINYGVDPSPQGANLGVSLYHVLVDERPLGEAILPVGDRLWLVPSSIDLAAAEIELVTVMGREMLLKNSIDAAIGAAGTLYDFVLMDCPPSLGLLTINALSAASEVIIPMQPHFLALQGVAKLLETVQLVNKRMNPRLRVSGIVLTMYDSQTKLTGEVVGEMRSFIEGAKGKALPWAEARIFSSKIRRNIKLAESPSFGQTILKYDSASNGAADYRALAAEIAGMGDSARGNGESAVGTPVVTINHAIEPGNLAAAGVGGEQVAKA
jgi:chromosome partitioning protein